jgi:hypothetical protein
MKALFAAAHESGIGPARTSGEVRVKSAKRGIVLQKSKVAAPRIFRENNKRETVVPYLGNGWVGLISRP